MQSRTDIVERYNIWVMHTWDGVEKYPSLMRFWETLLHEKFAQVDPSFAEKDIENYRRGCELRPMEPAEFGRFYLNLCPALPTAFRATAMDHPREIVVCRDEPALKETLWKTDEYYWHLIWTMG